MTDMNSEKNVREKVRQLREFYKHLVVYCVVNVGCIFIWIVSGGGYFWPIWVIIGWGIGLTLQSISLGMMPMAKEVLPFLSSDWEEQQVKKMMGRGKSSKSSAPKSPDSEKK